MTRGGRAVHQLRVSAEIVYWPSIANPFTRAVELISFAMHGQLDPTSLAVVAGGTVAAFLLAARL